MRQIVVVLAGSAVVALAVLVITRQSMDNSAKPRPVAADSVVMLGDSITAEGPWPNLFPEFPIVNRGFPGFTSAQLVPVAREVAAEGPRAVFILAGTNDIRDARPVAWTSEHLTAILDVFESEAPSTIVVIQTILPRSDRSAEVALANSMITNLALERGVPVLDLHDSFDDGDGGLRAGESRDGLHLTRAGYERWAVVLKPALAALP
jgi:lysophospholipase L1-like esterase